MNNHTTQETRRYTKNYSLIVVTMIALCKYLLIYPSTHHFESSQKKAQRKYNIWIENKQNIIERYVSKGYEQAEAQEKYTKKATKKFQKTLRESAPSVKKYITK